MKIYFNVCFRYQHHLRLFKRQPKYHQTSKNKVIVEAIDKFLTEQEDIDAWHPDILNWQGVPKVEFDLETDRDLLLPSREQIF